jgi:hypothetical protein
MYLWQEFKRLDEKNSLHLIIQFDLCRGNGTEIGRRIPISETAGFSTLGGTWWRKHFYHRRRHIACIKQSCPSEFGERPLGWR